MAHQRKGDIVEIIYQKDNQVVSKTFTNSNCEIKEASNLLFELGHDVLLFLDLHGVTDLFNNTDPISNLSIVVISFLGRKSLTRTRARLEIIDRITNEQIKCGVFVFKRTDKPKVIGTKAWVLEKMVNQTNDKKKFFMDDSADHIQSVTESKITNLIPYEIKDQLSPKSSLIKLIKKIESECEN